MTQLEFILDKYNFPRRKDKKEIKFSKIEQRVGFLLPADYKFYLENYEAHEEFVGPELINLWSIDELLQTNQNTGIFDNLSQTLGIGNNPSSEFIAIEPIDNNCRLVLSPLIDLNREYHIEIGSSFTDLFIRLDNNKKWFG